MRILFAIFISVFLLSGCGGNVSKSADLLSPQNGKTEAVKRPRIPDPEGLKANVLGTEKDQSDNEKMQKLLDDIESQLDKPNISEDDIKRGWYYATEQDKKFGTPSSWIWQANGNNPRWISPNAMEEKDYFELSDLCVQTAGSYVISCLDAEIANCEYIPKSECRCIEGSKWDETQGCILTDEKGDYVSISQDELKKGWYTGLPNEKKLGTPLNWVWIDAGQDSRWQNPSPK